MGKILTSLLLAGTLAFSSIGCGEDNQLNTEESVGGTYGGIRTASYNPYGMISPEDVKGVIEVMVLPNPDETNISLNLLQLEKQWVNLTRRIGDGWVEGESDHSSCGVEENGTEFPCRTITWGRINDDYLILDTRVIKNNETDTTTLYAWEFVAEKFKELPSYK